MANIVQVFRSSDANGPGTVTGQVGSLITILNACLVDGYTTASVTSITESGTTYTVTLAAANTTLKVLDYITISGGSPSGINGDWRITEVTDTTHVKFTGPGSLGTITGTILYKKTGLGWTKPYTGTNGACYRSSQTNGGVWPQYYLRVDDNGTVAATLALTRGYETMSSYSDTSGNAFPLAADRANGDGMYKSSTADATTRSWTLAGDGRFFYWFPNCNDMSYYGRQMSWFGVPNSYGPSDTTACCIGGPDTVTSFQSTGNGALINSLCYTDNSPSTNGQHFARLVTGIAGAKPSTLMGYTIQTSNPVPGYAVSGHPSYPHAPDGGLLLFPLLVTSSYKYIHARMPGLYYPFHSMYTNNHGDRISNITGLSGVTLEACWCSSSTSQGLVYIDCTGPW